MSNSVQDIAGSFVAARRAGKPLAGFPGQIPADLDQAYQVQDAAIAMWGDQVTGWKIGRPPPHQSAALGADRIAGPIFAALVWRAQQDEGVEFPVFEGGFAAVEAEYVLRIGADAPAGRTEWTRADAADLVAAMHIGVETAGSPLATINDLGATVVVSDFGNNHGLILGAEIPRWREKLDQGLACETFIDDLPVGAGQARAGPDDPIEALVFLLGHLAKRGQPLRAGQVVSTGAVTGVHDIAIGQHARVSFDGAGVILCKAVKAPPQRAGF